MKRRKAILGMAGFGMLSLLPAFPSIAKKPLHIIGIGQGGSSALETFKNEGIGDFHTIIDSKFKDKEPGINFIHLEGPNSREKVEALAYGPEVKIKPLNLGPLEGKFENDHRYVLLTALSGYTGTKVVHQLIPKFLANGADFSVICSHPFNFEGKKRMEIAQETTNRFSHLSQYRYFENEKMREQFGNLKMSEVFKLLDEEFLKIWKSEFMANSIG